eukprot:CAMPEP_0203669120 /NCGR_PEP_ID=MMETSP0090-20130426/5575_1 /ASSEMBLY_ACC=CAM_ASM_001088 /TAXON_ID=426623 /ORGANISM="Chaetoceros affinis, Strain CCMP159" /LENGTH=395 /DNA_ID=CAMNT_0050533723 /DNA_START=55 /DNA_END=1239 /DNA_ORIENTATION=-
MEIRRNVNEDGSGNGDKNKNGTTVEPRTASLLGKRKAMSTKENGRAASKIARHDQCTSNDELIINSNKLDDDGISDNSITITRTHDSINKVAVEVEQRQDMAATATRQAQQQQQQRQPSKIPIIPEYVEICKKKKFLISKRVLGHDDMQNMSINKQVLEIERGAYIGGGATRTKLNSGGVEPFQEGVPLGPGSTIMGEELCLYHPNIDDCWKDLYVHYGSMTTYGHIILAGSIAKFVHWARSRPCQKEVRGVPNGRLFIYIEHETTCSDGCINNSGVSVGKGYIVSVDKDSGTSAPTVNDGKGYQLLMTGSYYDGYFRDGRRHGEGGTYFHSNGNSYKANWAHGEISCCDKCLNVLQELFREEDPLLKKSNKQKMNENSTVDSNGYVSESTVKSW